MITMRFFQVLAVFALLCLSVEAFVSSAQKQVRRSLSIKAFEDADSLLDKLAKTDSTSFMPPAPAPITVETPPPVIEAVPVPSVTAVPVEVVTSAADVAATAPPPPVEAVAPVVDQLSSTATDLMASFGDLPILPIAIGAIAVIAAVVAMSGGGDTESSPDALGAVGGGGTKSIPDSPAAAGGVDLSIPYDAAARLAYEKAGRPGDYASFKVKYEADAIAEVKAKQKK